jgi:hypothetical protein
MGPGVLVVLLIPVSLAVCATLSALSYVLI